MNKEISEAIKNLETALRNHSGDFDTSFELFVNAHETEVRIKQANPIEGLTTYRNLKGDLIQ